MRARRWALMNLSAEKERGRERSSGAGGGGRGGCGVRSAQGAVCVLRGPELRVRHACRAVREARVRRTSAAERGALPAHTADTSLRRALSSESTACSGMAAVVTNARTTADGTHHGRAATIQEANRSWSSNFRIALHRITSK